MALPAPSPSFSRHKGERVTKSIKGGSDPHSPVLSRSIVRIQSLSLYYRGTVRQTNLHPAKSAEHEIHLFGEIGARRTRFKTVLIQPATEATVTVASFFADDVEDNSHKIGKGHGRAWLRHSAKSLAWRTGNGAPCCLAGE